LQRAMIGLRGRTALVTGVAHGNIGHAVARRLAEEGANLLLIGRDESRTAQVSSEIKEAIQGKSPQPEVITEVAWRAADLASIFAEIGGGLGAFLASVRKEIPEIQVLVHSAGVAWDASFLKTTADIYRKTFAVNLEAPFFLTQEILRTGWMKEGAIVNIGSTVGEPTHGWVGGMVYSMSKAALLQWSQMLAVELAPRIRVNTILPGSIDTPMADRLLGEAGKKDMAGRIPLGRLGSCEDIASVVIELVRNPYISGAEVRVDGARTVGD
jgi:NAD(P)-dependent dehydrogenase (short-subunit alcohol dehydrogenase family)